MYLSDADFMFETKRKGVAEAMAPWLLLIMLVFIVIIAIMVYLKAMSMAYSDTSKATDYALHAMLESTNCTPVTKLPFRNVLAIGISEGKTSRDDKINIVYGNKIEGDVLDILPGLPPTITEISVKSCMDNFLKSGALPTSFYFYVDQAPGASLCPDKICFRSAVQCPTRANCNMWDSPSRLGQNLNVEYFEYIALPSGDVAKVVLKTKG